MYPDSIIALRNTHVLEPRRLQFSTTLSLVDMMKVEPFSLNVDGSNDNDLLTCKLYPLCAHIEKLAVKRITRYSVIA